MRQKKKRSVVYRCAAGQHIQKSRNYKEYMTYPLSPTLLCWMMDWTVRLKASVFVWWVCINGFVWMLTCLWVTERDAVCWDASWQTVKEEIRNKRWRLLLLYSLLPTMKLINREWCIKVFWVETSWCCRLSTVSLLITSASLSLCLPSACTISAKDCWICHNNTCKQSPSADQNFSVTCMMCSVFELDVFAQISFYLLHIIWWNSKSIPLLVEVHLLPRNTWRCFKTSAAVTDGAQKDIAISLLYSRKCNTEQTKVGADWPGARLGFVGTCSHTCRVFCFEVLFGINFKYPPFYKPFCFFVQLSVCLIILQEACFNLNNDIFHLNMWRQCFATFYNFYLVCKTMFCLATKKSSIIY